MEEKDMSMSERQDKELIEKYSTKHKNKKNGKYKPK